MVICLEQGVDLHMAQLMPLSLTVSCFIKIQIGITFLVPAHLGRPGKMVVKWVCVCVCACVCFIRHSLTLSFQALNLPRLKPFFLEILPIVALVSYFQN